MNKKKLILIDIDYTLFNAATFREYLFSAITQAVKPEITLTKEQCQQIYEEYVRKADLFSPEDYIALLVGNYAEKQHIVEKVMRVLFDEKEHKKHLYEESESAVVALGKLGELGIFSQGYEKFQKTKLDSIAHYFSKEHIHIVVNKKQIAAEIAEQYKDRQVYLIDDALPVLAELKKHAENVYTIWMKRGRYAQKQEPIPGFQPDSVVVDLNQAVGVIKEN